MQFSKLGILIPPDKISTSLLALKEELVQKYSGESTRHNLFVNYLHYIQEFKKGVSPNFTHWIFGSFVTQKESPEDLDFVNLIDYQDYEAQEKLIDDTFRGKSAKEIFGLDAYTIRIYPPEHPKFVLTKSDISYWHDFMTQTRPNSKGEKLRKGFLEIKYQ